MTALAARVEIDGRPATAEQLRASALGGYGHFTAMQVRNGRARGLDLHLARLAAGNRELFDAALDAAAVRDHIRHALGDSGDASVRVYVCELADRPSVIVTVRPPGGMPGGPWKLQSVPYQRAVAHIKHVGDFGQGYYQRLARGNGFDEALLTGPEAEIAEGSITNVGFCDGASIIWPAAPALAGITMQLLDRELPATGLTSRRARVRVPDVGSFTGAFVTNARGIAAVGQIDGHVLAVDGKLMTTLTDAYQSVSWDLI
ncbi:MAG TPA: aminotransferase class IV [Trebonia sp.]|nr:aminotransferase class IV [Trebonia sp.]